MELGDRIKQRRTAMKRSQEDLAECIGVARPTLTFWENNEKNPGSNYLVNIASCLSVSVEWLLTGKEFQPVRAASDKIDDAAFLTAYRLFEDAVLTGKASYSEEIKAKCLVEMYYAEQQGNSPAAAMLEFLTSSHVQ